MLAIVNYLDLVGVLGIGWTNGLVGWIATAWTLAVGVVLEPDDEVRARLNDLAGAFLGALALGVAAVFLRSDVGMTYLFQATPLGQLAYAILPAVANALFVLAIAYGAYLTLTWLSEYWHLRRTTPEERVLGEDCH